MSAQVDPADPLAVRLNEIAVPYLVDAEPIGPILAGYLDLGTPSRFVEVPVDRGACYSILAVPENDGADLDLYLYAGPVEVGSDVGVGSAPRVHWCNTDHTVVSLEIRFHNGHGRYIFQVLRASDSDTGDTLELAINGLAARFADGYRPAAASQFGTLPTGSHQDFEVRLAAGRCYVIVAAGSETVRDLDLELHSLDGELIDLDRATHAQPVLRYCTPRTSGVFTLRVLLVTGFGDFRFRLFSD